jgi:hypothetical protein
MTKRHAIMEDINEGPQELEDTGWDEPIEIPQDARNTAVIFHILGAAGFIGPLVIWTRE